MSVRVSTLVWDNGPESSADRLLMLALADNADDNGFAFPGLERLAEKCCVTVKSASATVKRLEALGWLTVARSRGRGKSSRYQMNMERLKTPRGRDLGKELKPPVDAVKPPVDGNKTPRGRGGNHQEPSEVQPSLVVVADDTPDEEKPKRQAKRATQLPESWMPNDQHLAFVRANNLNGGLELAQFRDHHTAKGSTMKDWDAAFRTWLRNASKWQGGAGLRSVPGTAADPNAWMRRPGVGG